MLARLWEEARHAPAFRPSRVLAKRIGKSSVPPMLGAAVRWALEEGMIERASKGRYRQLYSFTAKGRERAEREARQRSAALFAGGGRP